MQLYLPLKHTHTHTVDTSIETCTDLCRQEQEREMMGDDWRRGSDEYNIIYVFSDHQDHRNQVKDKDFGIFKIHKLQTNKIRADLII